MQRGAAHHSETQKYTQIQSGPGGVSRLSMTENTSHLSPRWLRDWSGPERQSVRDPVKFGKHRSDRSHLATGLWDWSQ